MKEAVGIPERARCDEEKCLNFFLMDTLFFLLLFLLATSLNQEKVLSIDLRWILSSRIHTITEMLI